ncbi:hypothetical protein MVEG_00666 [Podila verticillata NRRL 6337]|nr:hypothetical protein MVEG_00666 [Podila verticillata NRRL 6337]
MKFLAVIITVIATAAALDSPVFPFVWKDCATPGTTDQTVTNFTLKQSFCPGKIHTVIATGPVTGDIVAPSKLAISGKFLGRVIYTDNKDFCALLAAAGTPCPVAAGTPALTFDVLLKPSWPTDLRGQFTYQVTNGNNRVLFCQAATMESVSTVWNGTCVVSRPPK